MGDQVTRKTGRKRAVVAPKQKEGEKTPFSVWLWEKKTAPHFSLSDQSLVIIVRQQHTFAIKRKDCRLSLRHILCSQPDLWTKNLYIEQYLWRRMREKEAWEKQQMQLQCVSTWFSLLSPSLFHWILSEQQQNCLFSLVVTQVINDQKVAFCWSWVWVESSIQRSDSMQSRHKKMMMMMTRMQCVIQFPTIERHFSFTMTIWEILALFLFSGFRRHHHHRHHRRRCNAMILMSPSLMHWLFLFLLLPANDDYAVPRCVPLIACQETDTWHLVCHYSLCYE